ncbi:MAG: exosortase-associated EpsI family protein [Pirellulales bacterium]|nr:exosortase-associated EpsI family protein [Pirellulales bacterium]
MKQVGQISIVVLAIGVTVAAAIHQGHLTNRWGASQRMEAAVPVLQSLPKDLGPWRLDAPDKLPPEVVKTLQCPVYAGGQYSNRETGETVLVSALLGPPGTMSVHRPEICFSAISFPQETDRQRTVILSDGIEHSAWKVQFRDMNSTDGGIMRVYYAWSDDGVWSAAEQPRIAFGTKPFLFKVQVVVRLSEAAASQASDPGQSFLSEFIPVFRKLIDRHKLGRGNKQ